MHSDPESPPRQIIRDTRRVDFYLDAVRAKDYGLIDDVLGHIDAIVATLGPAEPAGEPKTEEPAAAESSRK